MNYFYCTFSFLILLFLFPGCGNDQTNPGTRTFPGADTSRGGIDRNAALRKTIGQISDSAKGKVGVAILELETGDTVSFNGHEHFPMQSVFKFPLAVYAFALVDRERVSWNEDIFFAKEDLHPGTYSPLAKKYPGGNVTLKLMEVLRYTICQSDNDGCDRLFRFLGGVDSVNTFIHGLGVMHMSIVATEAQMHADWPTQYKNWSDPFAMLRLLEIVHKRQCLSPGMNDSLLKLMKETTTGPKRLRGLLPPETEVAHKTGTGPTDKSGVTSATNDVGIITLPNGKHMAIVVFVSDSGADETIRERTIARIARAGWDYFIRR